MPTAGIVLANRSLHSISTAASYERLLSLQQPSLPCAWKNCQRSPGPDSLLLLQLVDPAPASLCRPYKKKRANMRTLAILIQSKQRRSLAGRKKEEAFDEELRKCRRCPFPFLFVMITDSERSLLPDKPNAIYVGQERLEQLYGPMLCALRKEEWHMPSPSDYVDEDPEEDDDEPEVGESPSDRQ